MPVCVSCALRFFALAEMAMVSKAARTAGACVCACVCVRARARACARRDGDGVEGGLDGDLDDQRHVVGRRLGVAVRCAGGGCKRRCRAIRRRICPAQSLDIKTVGSDVYILECVDGVVQRREVNGRARGAPNAREGARSRARRCRERRRQIDSPIRFVRPGALIRRRSAATSTFWNVCMDLFSAEGSTGGPAEPKRAGPRVRARVRVQAPARDS